MMYGTGRAGPAREVGIDTPAMMNADRRPDADELLARVQEEERRARRGKLTIFFGAAPGVGKTYAMLECARSERDLRRDVVVGLVETHGRYDTAALTIGLELLPRRKLEYRGMKLEELDLDAVLARRPGLVLVDELAHTNAPGSRHVKRWQDVEELLDAGIDVYTTLNVQHIESLNDVIARITGVTVSETVPDRIVEEADEIRLVDLTPEELLDRLAEGKVYVPEQARRALSNFFRKGNLIALRELALRQTAERVDEQLRSEKRAEGVERAWPVGERILVCVGSSADDARLLRAARRMATSLRAEWIAVHVETPASVRMSDVERERIAENLRLAERLGAETVRLSGENAAEEAVYFARSRNVTRMIVGKPSDRRWRHLVRPSFLEEVVRRTPDIDVHVITSEEREVAQESDRAAVTEARPKWPGWVAATVAAVCSTALAWLLFGRDQLPDVIMVYLFGVVLVALRFGYRASIVAALLCVLALDFFFIPPYHAFSVSDVRHLVTFAVMFGVAVVIGRLSQRIRDQADAVRRREARTSRLYAMSRELTRALSIDDVLRIAARHVGEAFGGDVCVLLPDAAGRLAVSTHGPGTFALDRNDSGVPDWVWDYGKPAGLGTETLPAASARFLLLRGARANIGVFGFKPKEGRRWIDPEQERLLETFVNQVASTLERVLLVEEARRAEVQVESERLRGVLLNAVSADIHAPLGAIAEATHTLLKSDDSLAPSARRALLETTCEQAGRLGHLVQNLLDMTKIASGALQPKKEPRPLVEIVASARARLDTRLRDRRLEVALPADLPPLRVDPVLIEHVFIELLDNAVTFGPADQPIEIGAVVRPGFVEVCVADRGPGVSRAETERVFDEFYRVRHGDGGAGLGLAICRSIVEAHSGRIWVEERDGGGARFCFTLPTELQAAPVERKASLPM